MTNPYRAMCAELLAAIEQTEANRQHGLPLRIVTETLNRARALLAQPVAKGAPPAPETPAEALAARPLLEQVARLGDCIGANTVGQITAISNRAAAWLRENPPGQPVAIEPRGCPTPGACSCVKPAAPPTPDHPLRSIPPHIAITYQPKSVYEPIKRTTTAVNQFIPGPFIATQSP